jgi:hypothetical protein
MLPPEASVLLCARFMKILLQVPIGVGIAGHQGVVPAGGPQVIAHIPDVPLAVGRPQHHGDPEGCLRIGCRTGGSVMNRFRYSGLCVNQEQDKPGKVEAFDPCWTVGEECSLEGQ